MRTTPIPVSARVENIKLHHMSGEPLAAERARGDLYRELLEVIAWEDESWARSIKLVLQAEKVEAAR